MVAGVTADTEAISEQTNADNWTQNEANIDQINVIMVPEVTVGTQIICDQSDSDSCKTLENELVVDRSKRHIAKEPTVGTEIISDQPIADEYTDKDEPVDVEIILDQSITDELAAIGSEP